MTYNEIQDTLDPLDLLAVKIGEKIEAVNNKVTVIDKGRIVTMTKAGYDAMQKDEDGSTTFVPTEVLGFAEFERVGKVNKLVIKPFGGEAAEPVETKKKSKNQ